MNNNHKVILEWLIEGIDFSDKRKLFDVEKEKEITTEQEVISILHIEMISFGGRPLIRIIGTTIYFYPLAIKNYLDCDGDEYGNAAV